MELVHGIGLYPAHYLSSEEGIISSIVNESPIWEETGKICQTFEEVCEFHTHLMKKMTAHYNIG